LGSRGAKHKFASVWTRRRAACGQNQPNRCDRGEPKQSRQPPGGSVSFELHLASVPARAQWSCAGALRSGRVRVRCT